MNLRPSVLGNRARKSRRRPFGVHSRLLTLESLEERTLLTLAPPEPLLVDLQSASDSGRYDDDNLTNVQTPVIDVTAARLGDTLRVYRAGTLLGDATLVDGTLYRYTFASGQLLSGGNSIVARSFDGVAESGDSTALAIALDTAGPRITGATPDAPINLHTHSFESVTVTFSEPLDFDPPSGTFIVADVALAGPQGPITPTGITSLVDNQYQIGFAAQTARGTYTAAVGPSIADLAGNPMDQNQDGQPGRANDAWTGRFDVINADTVFTTPITIAPAPAERMIDHSSSRGAAVLAPGRRATGALRSTVRPSGSWTTTRPTGCSKPSIGKATGSRRKCEDERGFPSPGRPALGSLGHVR